MEIKTVGVLGIGVVGHGIAQVAAQSGYNVIAGDMSDDIALKGYERISHSLDKLVSRGKIAPIDKTTIMDRIKPTGDIAEMSRADYVVEAIFEDMELKKQAFRELDRLTRPKVVLSSNTSTNRS